MGRSLIETVLGAVVILIACAFVYVAATTAQIAAVRGYDLSASFLRIGGLAKGSDVRISGIKVGTVLGRSIDPATFDAKVVMSIQPDIKLPTDTVASIASEGLLGGKYVRLKPGTSTDRIAPGGKIAKTEDFKTLEEQVGEIIFFATGGD